LDAFATTLPLASAQDAVEQAEADGPVPDGDPSLPAD